VELAIGTWRISVWRLPPSPSELRRLYDTTAWYWNSFLHRMPFGSAYVRLFKQLEKDGWLGGTGDTTRVLDCGVGTGLFSGALLRTVNRRFEICGIDLSPCRPAGHHRLSVPSSPAGSPAGQSSAAMSDERGVGPIVVPSRVGLASGVPRAPVGGGEWLGGAVAVLLLSLCRADGLF
jgi:hypothetical protein